MANALSLRTRSMRAKKWWAPSTSNIEFIVETLLKIINFHLVKWIAGDLLKDGRTGLSATSCLRHVPKTHTHTRPYTRDTATEKSKWKAEQSTALLLVAYYCSCTQGAYTFNIASIEPRRVNELRIFLLQNNGHRVDAGMNALVNVMKMQKNRDNQQ